ncbi:TRAP transporter substrate-binding protein [Desulfotruncus alcoholivorax]|uniref:TRAP transporter substrate-binding protein n=1 Tax=Desulfotruncus alcoholivorax TaxID=265477 RepID=UPI0003F91315|nr:TRAP transporter substrate-binding protein [Desulfotruncus alcoholivorax]
MHNKSKSILLGFLILLLTLSLVACSSGGSGQSNQGSGDKPEFVLKFGHDQAPDHAYNQAAVWFAKEVNKRTDGRVKIDVFPNAQLGEESTMLDSLKMGTLDFCITSTSNASSHVPQMGLLSTSYLFNDEDHLYKVATDPEIINKFDKLVSEKNLGFKLITFLPNGLRSLYATREIKGINDVQGMKVRVMSSPIETKVWEAIGTKPTTVPFNEVYTALQTNLVEGAENTPSSYLTAKHYEVAHYFIETGHEWLMSEVWVSNKTWEKLPEDIRQIIMETGVEMARYGLDKQLENDNKALEELTSKYGVKDIKVDVTPFKERVKPLHEQIAKELKCEDVLARIQELGK